MKKNSIFPSLVFLFLLILLGCSKETPISDATLQKDVVPEQTPETTDTSSETTDDPSEANDPATIKAEVLALFNSVGRTSQLTLQSPTNSLPSGVSLNGENITISANGTILENYDLSGYTIFLNADNVTIKNCVLGDRSAPRNGKRVIDIKANIKNFSIEDNDFVGFKGLGYGVGSGVFQRSLTSTQIGIGGTIRRNSFKHFGQDCVKTSGGVLIEENIFYASSNITVIPSGSWDSGTTYDLNEVVKDPHGGQKHFISLVANNMNNQPPSQHNTSNAYWQFFDPHYDIVNPFENTIASIIRRNLFLTNTQDPMIPQVDKSYAVGIVNALRLVRNNSAAPTNFESLLVEENVILGQAVYGFGFPIQAANTGGLWINPTLKNNLIDENINGKYTHPSTASAVDWQENFDASTFTQINP